MSESATKYSMISALTSASSSLIQSIPSGTHAYFMIGYTGTERPKKSSGSSKGVGPRDDFVDAAFSRQCSRFRGLPQKIPTTFESGSIVSPSCVNSGKGFGHARILDSKIQCVLSYKATKQFERALVRSDGVGSRLSPRNLTHALATKSRG